MLSNRHHRAPAKLSSPDAHFPIPPVAKVLQNAKTGVKALLAAHCEERHAILQDAESQLQQLQQVVRRPVLEANRFLLVPLKVEWPAAHCLASSTRKPAWAAKRVKWETADAEASKGVVEDDCLIVTSLALSGRKPEAATKSAVVADPDDDVAHFKIKTGPQSAMKNPLPSSSPPVVLVGRRDETLFCLQKRAFTVKPNVSIALKAGGPRTVVELEEAVRMRKRFERVLRTDDTQCHMLDLSCRAWRLESVQALQPVLTRVAATIRMLKIDDIIASLPTEQGLASLDYLARTFATAPLLSQINLNDNAVGTRGIACLRPLLTNTSVTSLSLENCGIAEDDGAELRKILSHQSSLLSLRTGRNQMGVAGAMHIGALLSQCTQLQSFSYAGSRPLKEGTAALCRGLQQMSAACKSAGTRLHSLDLNDCCLGDNVEKDPVVDMCAVVQNSPLLHTLILRDGELQLTGLKMVLTALVKSGAALTTLDLGAIGDLGEKGGVQVRDYLLTSPTRATLQHLSLDTNELGCAGVAAVAEGAEACCALQTLNLEANEIETSGAEALLHHYIPTLQKLQLEDNLELPGGAARQLQNMYPTVTVDEDLEEADEEEGDEDVEDDEQKEDKDSVDALADLMKAAHI